MTRARIALALAVVLVLPFAAATAGCGAGVGGTFGKGNTKKQRALRTRAAAPSHFVSQRKFDGDPQVVKVRVYATDAFRAQNVRWRERIIDQIDLASQLLVPELGVRLEVTEARPWEVEGDENSLQGLLEELERLDDADDVEWVIGFASSLTSASPQVHDLGMARTLGRHIILRGINEIEDREDLAARDVHEDAVERLVASRKRHKQTLVLLHEILHTLGAMHVENPAWVMNPNYSRKLESLSQQNGDLVREVATERIGKRGPRAQLAQRKALLRYLQSNEWGGWLPGERDELMAWLDSQGVAEAELDPEKAPSGPKIPREAKAQFERAVALTRKGEVAAARSEVEALVAAYPANAEIRLLECQFAVASRGLDSEQTSATCDTAADIIGGPQVYLFLASAHAQAGDRATAIATVDRARAEIAEGDTEAWLELAEVYRQLGAITRTEEALDAGGVAMEKHEIGQWARQTRARYGVPRNGARHKITPANEPDYVDRVVTLLQLVYGEKYAEAQKLARDTLRKYPNAPGVRGIQCDLELRRKNAARARQMCKRAVAAFDGASWPHYLLGVLDFNARKLGRAAHHLEHAIEVDPNLHQAYRALAKVYAHTDADDQLEQLREAYFQRFRQRLP